MPRTKQIALVEQQCKVKATLAKYLELRNISEEELAAALRITTRTLRNKKEAPETFLLGELQTISMKLRCPIEELCGGIDYSKEFKAVTDTLISIARRIS